MANTPGPPDGEHTHHDDAGVLRQQGHFAGGTPEGLLKVFDKEGRPAIEEHYVAGKLHGPRRMYTAGLLALEAAYQEDLQEGPATLFHPSGVPAAKMHFRNGVQEGETAYFDDAGLLTQRRQFAGGILHGDTTSYYENGNTLSIEPYDKGLLHGEARWFDPDGEWTRKIVYERGKRLSVHVASAPPAPTPVQTLLQSIRKRGK